MAKKKEEIKKYLYGTFGGSKGSLTINAKTKQAEIEKYLKANPKMEALLTDSNRIAEQRALMAKGKDEPKSK